MSRSASYNKTLSNNQTEDEVLLVVLRSDPRYQLVDTKTRSKILDILGLRPEFTSRVFDLIRTSKPLPPLTVDTVANFMEGLVLVEVKSTQAPIVDESLHGFFFGATDNEYRIAKLLGTRYLFAFVVLRPSGKRSPFFVPLNLEDVEARTKTKRMQYQVNFRSAKQEAQRGPSP